MEMLYRLYHGFENGFVGSVGALVAFLLHKSDHKDLSKLVTFLVVGCLIAQFTVRPIAKALHVAPENVVSISFLIGAFGGAIFTAIIKAINDLELGAFVKELVRAKLGVKPESTSGENHE